MKEIIESIKLRSDKYERVVEACQTLLEGNTKAYIDSRLDSSAQTKYGFGYFPSNDKLHVLFDLISPSILEELSLVYPKYISGGSFTHGHFNNHNLIMPFRDSYGRIVSLLGRTILSQEKQKELKLQKYKYTFGSNKNVHIFGLDTAKQDIIDKNCVICVEGQFDYIALAEHGIKNAVAFGCANISKYQFFQLHKLTNNFIVMFDNDEAGTKGKRKIKKRYSKYANIKTVSIPKPYKDVYEYLMSNENKDEFLTFCRKEHGR